MPYDSAFQSFPEIETKRLLLRRIQVSDSGALLKVLSDAEVARYYDDEAYTNVSQAIDQIKSWESGFTNRRCIRWGITRKVDRVVIGSCGYYGFHLRHMRASIGYELARPFWRQGIMTEALRAILLFGFQELSLNRVEAVVMPENFASIKLLEKLGFQNEGLLEEYENWGGKGFVSLCMLSLLRKSYADSISE